MRCLNRKSKCPGYDRGLKFQDQTRYIAQKHGRLTIDEAFAPNLTYEAINVQTQESFDVWMDYHFPIYAPSCNSRVDVNWMDFIRSRWSVFPQALIWGIRALTTLRMGALQGNKNAILCARHMYSRGINHLAYLLSTQAALADETLAAAILLGGYEILDGCSDRSWISHARGIRHLICARGPSAHKKGIGRTLLLCWRPYLVADAFMHLEPCFLGGKEWACTSMASKIADAEGQPAKCSLLGQMMDCAFDEIAKCPGYCGVTKDIISSDTVVDQDVLDGLMNDILQSRKNLVEIHHILLPSLGHTKEESISSLTGAIPSIYATTLVQGSCDAISSAIALLDRLTPGLDSCSNRKIEKQLVYSTKELHGEHNAYPFCFSPEEQSLGTSTGQLRNTPDSEDFEASVYAIGDRLDKFSLTMGMGTLSAEVCDWPQFSARGIIQPKAPLPN